MRRPEITTSGAGRNAGGALLLACLLAPLPAAAQNTPENTTGPRMSAAEFEAYATGRTLTYAESGRIFGTEEYLPGRRVRWAFTEDICKIGHWYEQGDLICFTYEDESNPQCWAFWRDAQGLRARFNGDPAGTELSEVRQSETPLLCPGPDVGA